MSEFKVFEVVEGQYVAARSEQEAGDFYSHTIDGLSMLEYAKIRECTAEEGQYICITYPAANGQEYIRGLMEEYNKELSMSGIIGEIDRKESFYKTDAAIISGHVYIWVSFEFMLQYDQPTEPYLIWSDDSGF